MVKKHDGLDDRRHKPIGAEPLEARFRQNVVGSDFFRSMGIELLEGRDSSDSATAPAVAIVNETFAKNYIGTSNAVGHMMANSKGLGPRLIVGVVKDHKYTGITEPAMPMRWTILAQGGLETEMEV